MGHLDDITNFLMVFPWLGTAGQPKKDQLKDIQRAGFQMVINLALSTSPGAIADEGERIESLGMGYVHLPVIWEKPEHQVFITFSSLLNTHQGIKVFAHCVLNMRVSAFVYLHRILRMGHSEVEARQTMLEIWEPEGVWKEFIAAELAKSSKNLNRG